MLELLEKFNITDIIIFSILFALAIKGVFSFIEWAGQKSVKFMHYKYQKPKEMQNTVDHLKDNVDYLRKKVDLLIDSDKDDIKAYIIREHHYFCYQLKQIDDQSLECIERRYEHYRAQGGNTYIPDLMEDLRNLPKRTLKTIHNESSSLPIVSKQDKKE